MQNETLRALRRHHVERLKAKWKRSNWMHQPDQVDVDNSVEMQEKQAGMFAHTRRLCSCWMCGNPRKYSGQASIKERKVMQGKLADLDMVVVNR